MTDLEKLTRLFSDFNIPFTIATDRPNGARCVYVGDYDFDPNQIQDHSKGDENKIRRYDGFYTYYSFDDAGSFEFIGIYE